MCGCLGGNIPVARPFLLRSAPINKRDTSPYKRRSRRKGAGSTSRAWRNPTRGGGGCRGSAMGTPRSWDGNLASLRHGKCTGLVRRFLPASVPVSPAPSGCLSVGFSLSVPVLGLLVPQGPSSPKSSAGAGQELVAPKPSPASRAHPALASLPRGAWTTQGVMRVLSPARTWLGEGEPEPPPALQTQPGQAASGATGAYGPRGGQPAAAKLPAAFLRATVPHRGLAPSSRDALEPPPRVSGTRLQMGKLRHGVPGLPWLCSAGSWAVLRAGTPRHRHQGRDIQAIRTKSYRVPPPAEGTPESWVSPAPRGRERTLGCHPTGQDRDTLSPQPTHAPDNVPHGWPGPVTPPPLGKPQHTGAGLAPRLPWPGTCWCPQPTPREPAVTSRPCPVPLVRCHT